VVSLNKESHRMKNISKDNHIFYWEITSVQLLKNKVPTKVLAGIYITWKTIYNGFY
jgi:hypothetical protein